jgi:hypothetical protein
MGRGGLKRALAALALAAMAACGASNAPSAEPEETPAIAPSAFAVMRCPGLNAGMPCLVVMAGGKTLVFGAPEGVTGALEQLERPIPDAVFVATLNPDGLEGLARLRNRSWVLGRTLPLSLVGPDGIDTFAAHLDEAHARSDAVVYLNKRPAGNFDAALLAPTAVPPAGQARVFDTGDLTVDALAALSGQLTYLVRYDGRALQISPCNGPVTPMQGVPLDISLDCDALSDPAGWPFPARTHLIVQ